MSNAEHRYEILVYAVYYACFTGKTGGKKMATKY